MNCAHVVDGVVLLGTKNEQASQNPVSAKWRCGFKGFLFIGNVASWRDISKHKNYFNFSFSPLLIAFISVKKQRKRRVFFLLIYIKDILSFFAKDVVRIFTFCCKNLHFIASLCGCKICIFIKSNIVFIFRKCTYSLITFFLQTFILIVLYHPIKLIKGYYIWFRTFRIAII